jgi:hypothetical protein
MGTEETQESIEETIKHLVILNSLQDLFNRINKILKPVRDDSVGKEKIKENMFHVKHFLRIHRLKKFSVVLRVS